MSLRKQLEQKFGKVREQRGKYGTEFRVCCPMCAKKAGKVDRKFKLYVNPQRGFNCYRCGFKGKNLRFLLGTAVKLSPEDLKPVEKKTLKAKELYDTVEPLEFMDDSNCAVQYLRGRGFDPWVVGSMLQLQYVRKGRVLSRPEDGLYFNPTNTLLFPVFYQGQLVGWQYRLLYDPSRLDDQRCLDLGYPTFEGKIIRPPKYFTGGGLPKSQILYNGDQASKYGLVVVVEGGLDVAGVGPNAVGIYGKKLSDEQLTALRHWDVVALMLDPEAQDELQGAYRSLALIRRNPTIMVTPPNGKDPGDNRTQDNWRAIFEALIAKNIDPRKLRLPKFERMPRP